MIRYTHNKHSPAIKSIAIFNDNNRLIITSNYHRSFDTLIEQTQIDSFKATHVQQTEELVTFFTPIINHTTPNSDWNTSEFQTTLY